MLFALVLAAFPAAELPPLRLEVLEGRAELATEGGLERLTPPRAQRDLDGAGYLETGAMSRASLRWNGCATFELEGTNALEWREARAPAGALSIRFAQIDRLSFEVRRGPVRVELPGEWFLYLDHGAAFVRELSDGRLELEHAAGAPLLLSLQREGHELRPPWTVLAGARVRLDAALDEPQASAGTRNRVLSTWQRPERAARESCATPAAPWSTFSWPWPEHGALPLAAQARREAGSDSRRSLHSRLAPWELAWGAPR